LEEGLRGAGAHLYNGAGERYMLRYAPGVAERATRDVVSRSAYMEMMAGRAAPEGGVRIDAAHLGADFVLNNFPGMAERCTQFGYDLARGMVPISPTAHFFMGGAVIDKDCHTSLEKLFVAGEDAGGVHGANRLGGNGICESCVYGRQAGKALARYLSKSENRKVKESAPGMASDIHARLIEPLSQTGGRSPLENAGLDRFFERQFNVEPARAYKPDPAVYHMVAQELDVTLADCCMVAAHVWDTIGGQSLGMAGALITRRGNAPLPVPGLPQPTAVGPYLPSVAREMIRMWRS